MCTEAQHNEKIALLEKLVYGNPPLDQFYVISATQPYVLDYKERKHIFVWPSVDLNLSLEEVGNITVSANTWTELSFINGSRVFATNQTNPVSMFVRCTDNPPEGVAAGTASFLPLTNTSVLSSVVSSASSVSLVAANSNRKALFIFNDSNQILYIGYVAVASLTTSNYTTQIPASGFWEMPNLPVWTGVISGIWASANGNARITELS